MMRLKPLNELFLKFQDIPIEIPEFKMIPPRDQI